MHLFSGSSHPALAQKIAKELKVPLGKVHLKSFLCGERYVKFEESIRGQDVYLIQTGTKQPNEDLMELFLMCQAAKLSFAKTVHVVLPYYPYARQDRVAEPREPVSAKLVAHLLEESGADHVIVIDLHSDQIQGFFGIPVDALDARQIFAKYLAKKGLKNMVIVAPDVGGAKRAKKLAGLLGADLAILHKTRPGHHKTQMHEVVGNIEGKTCVLFDDMIDTAGTLQSAKKVLIEGGANKDVYVAATHGVFSEDAIKRLKEANFKEVIITDTIPNDPKSLPGLVVLSVAPLLGEVLKHVKSGKSVTEIYKQ